ncbi:MAG: hypothetical protein HY680_02125 [Chloroflexi bacterium]|nr:hypothetical protein [Chloroflexota bacterium]
MSKGKAGERGFGRLKGHRKLNYVRVGGINKITVHCLRAVIVFQAQALAHVLKGEEIDMGWMVWKVA